MRNCFPFSFKRNKCETSLLPEKRQELIGFGKDTVRHSKTSHNTPSPNGLSAVCATWNGGPKALVGRSRVDTPATVRQRRAEPRRTQTKEAGALGAASPLPPSGHKDLRLVTSARPSRAFQKQALNSDTILATLSELVGKRNQHCRGSTQLGVAPNPREQTKETKQKKLHTHQRTSHKDIDA